MQQNAERLALSPRQAAWDPKPAPTFVDALARLRQHFWFQLFATSVDSTDMSEVLTPELRRLIQIACDAA